MPRYVTQFSYTAAAWRDLTKNPEDRAQAAAALLETMGCRLENLYYTLGEHDGFLVYEAPDDTTAGAAILAALSPGHLRATNTTRAFTMDETIEMLKKAGTHKFAGPKG